MDIVDIYNTMKSQYLYSNSLLKKLSIVMVVLCAFTCYLPVILNYKLAVDENELENRLHTRFFLDALVCAIAVSFPMICDAVMDTELSWEFTLPRWVFVSALFIPSLTIYIPLNLGYRIAPLFICAYQARACLYTGTLLSFMIETGRSTLWAYGMFLTTVFLVVVVNMGAWRPFFAAPDSFLAIVWVLAIIVCAAIFFCSYVYLIADNMLGQVFDMTNNLSTSRRCATLYIFFLTCSLVIKTAIFMANNAQPTTETTLGVVLTLYVDVITVTVSFIVPGRIARFESLITRLQLDKKKDFVRYISHEIRTPLNTVTMGVELALSRLLKDFSKDDVAEILESVAESSDTAVGILDDLLLFDKLEEGKVVLEQRLVKLRDLLNSCVSPFYVQALQKSIQLTFSLQNGCTDCSLRDLSDLLVDVDIKKMSQVVRNLVSNAIKFTPSGGEVNVCVFYEPYLDSDSKEQSCTFIPPVDDVSVSTTTSFDIEQPCTSTSSSSQYRKLSCKKRNTGRLRIEVRDTGPGISLENQRKLFTQIIQFNAAELQGGGGSGLGLFISKSIVERHNGSIAVHSEGVPGKGCVFSIDLEARTTPPRGREVVALSPPREAFVVRQMSEPEASSDNEMSETDHSKLESGKRALVVDDSPLNRKMLVSILKMWFPTIDEAENGEESVKAVKTSQERGKPYDIIFMDNVMPVMDGVEATAAIRALGVRAPIIAVTGNVLPVDRTLMMDAGVNSIATKPLRLQQLEEILLSTKISSVSRVSAKENRGGLGSKSDSGRSVETPPSLSQKHESDPQTKYVEMAVINTPKALVVDDSLMNRKMLVSMLKSWYAVIDQAADGLEALRSVQESLASASPYDIIFMDGVMPTMGGIETTEAIRSLGVSTPIVAVTGNVSAEDRDAMLAAGVNVVASKPIRLQRVEEILKDVKKI